MNVPCVVSFGKKLTFYEFLGASEKATDEELKSAYKRSCLKFHPDRNDNKKEAEENFKVLQIVWATLGNPRKRADYDMLLALKRGKLQMHPQGIHIQFEVRSWGFGFGDTTTFTNTTIGRAY